MGQGASRLPKASRSRAAKPRTCVRFASHGVWCRIPVAGEDRGRPCWLRKGIGYRRLVHARSVGGQPSQETVSESAGRATYSRSVNSPLGRHQPTHLTAEVDIVLKFCPGSNSGQLEQDKENKKRLYVDNTGLSNRNDNLGIVRVPGGQWSRG